MLAGFSIIRVLGNAGKVSDSSLESPEREDISNGIAALIRGAKNRISGTGCALSVTKQNQKKIRI